MACAAAASAFSTASRDVAVPFDERRDRSALADHDLEELPDRVGDRPVVAVDQQKIALVVLLLGMSGQMDLADLVERKIGKIGECRKAMVGGRHEDVVDVEQQAAAGAPDDLADEVGLAHRRFLEEDVGRWVLEQDRPADRILHLVDMIGDTGEVAARIGQRQQVVEIGRRRGSTRRGARRRAPARSGRPAP